MEKKIHKFGNRSHCRQSRSPFSIRKGILLRHCRKQRQVPNVLKRRLLPRCTGIPEHIKGGTRETATHGESRFSLHCPYPFAMSRVQKGSVFVADGRPVSSYRHTPPWCQLRERSENLFLRKVMDAETKIKLEDKRDARDGRRLVKYRI